MNDTVLVLRTCGPNGESHNGFIWPTSGAVSAPDWDPTPECGHGLHGLLNGCGNGTLLDYRKTATARVVEVMEYDIVDLGGKVKFPRGTVVFSGTLDEAVAYLDAHGCAEMPVVKAIRAGGDDSTVAGGYGSTVSGGNGSILIIRHWDEASNRYRVAVGYVGENGIEPNVAYRLDESGKFAPEDKKGREE